MRILLFTLLCLSSTLMNAATLTDADIQQWTKAYKAVVNWAESTNIEDELENSTSATEYNQVFSQMLEQAQTTQHHQSILNILKSNGYADPTNWAAMGDRIMVAFMANEMDGNQAAVEQQLQQMKAMLASGMIPPDQKEMMEKMLNESSKALAAAAQAPAEDKAAVKRNKALLNTVFDSGEQ